MALVRSISSLLGVFPCSTTTTMPVLNCFCEWSTSGRRGPSAAITSWIVTFVRSALKIGWPLASLPAGTRFLQDEKVGDFRRRDQAHEIEIEIRPARRRNVVIVVELRKGAVEVILPDAAAHGGRFRRAADRETRPAPASRAPNAVGPSGIVSPSDLRRDEGRPAVAHLMPDLRHRVVVRRHVPVRRALAELMVVGRDIVHVAYR